MMSKFTQRKSIIRNAVCTLAIAVSVATPAAASPILATATQLATEQRALRILARPEVVAATARERQVLLADPAAQVPDGKALLDYALSQWVNSLTFALTNADPSRPAILWGTEDTPRTWFGHTLPAGGVAGDNPDNVYLGTHLDGSSSYTLTGRIPANGPGNLTIEIYKGEPGRLKTTAAHAGKTPQADIGNQVRMFQQDDFHADAEGRFTITLGPDAAGDRATHAQTPPGPVSVIIRNTLVDWRQVPIEVSIRRTDSAPSRPPLSDEEIAKHVAEYLPDYVAAWATLKEHYLGEPPVNQLAGPLPRDGGWGWLAGGKFDLKPDEALIVTTASNGARYSGFQLLNRWFLSADARKGFTSLNNSQAVHNPDGTTTYIIALSDPGYANWLDTIGSPHGFAILRWQGFPAGADGKGLLRSVQLVKLTDLQSALPSSLPKVSPAERAIALKAHAADYESRLSVEAR